MENCNKRHREMGGNRVRSQHVNKGSLHEESSSGGKNRMRNQPYPTLFVRSMKEALGSAFSSRLRRVASKPEPSKRQHSRNLITISTGVEKEQVTDEGVTGDKLSRNRCSSARGTGESLKTSTRELTLSQDSSIETCGGRDDGFSSSNVLYPRPLSREAKGYRPRKDRFTNPIALQTSSECSHNNTTVLSFSGNRHGGSKLSPHPLDPLSAKNCKRNIEINSTSQMNSYSDPRSSTSNDSQVIDSSLNRKYNNELHLSSRGSQLSEITVNQSSNDTNNNSGDLSMEEKCSTTTVNLSRSNNYELIKASPKENKSSDCKRRDVNINNTFDWKLSGLDGSSLPHKSFKWVRKNDCAANWSVNDILHNDAIECYPSMLDKLNGPLVHPSFDSVSYNNTASYPVNAASRHDNTLFQVTEETWRCDVALNQTSRHSECSDAASGPITKAYRQRNSIVRPKSILRKPAYIDDCSSLNPTWQVSVESCRASTDSQFVSIKKQEPACGVNTCEKALNLLLLHDSAADEKREMKLSFKSNLPSTKLQRHVRIQPNSTVQERVATVVYPQPLLRNPRYSNRRYNESTAEPPSYSFSLAHKIQ